MFNNEKVLIYLGTVYTKYNKLLSKMN
jgi:hypothetical protein